MQADVQAKAGVSAPAARNWPGAVHAFSLVASLAFWAWTDKDLWFFGDEWDFLARRGLSFPPGSQRSIWFPHNEHWSTLPILAWRALYSIFHLSSYWPYLVPLLLAGTGVAHLAWRLALRCGADPWVATFSAGLLAFLGAGASDMASAFQVTFVGSVLFGMLALVAFEGKATTKGHLGPKLKDAVGSFSLLAALMCSTVGDAMVVGAAVLLFARRPWRRALAVLALPLGCYLTWFSFLGRPSLSAPREHFGLSAFTTLPAYVFFGLAGALGHSAGASRAGAVALVGLAAWVAWRLHWLWDQAPVLLALSASALAFYLLAGIGRDQTPGAFTVVSRYVWVAMAILVPVIAKALSPLPQGRASPALRVVACSLLAGAALGNVGQAHRWAAAQARERSTLERQLVAIGRLLGTGAQDVSGPGASPLELYPALPAASIEHLQRAKLLPDLQVGPVVRAQARELLALATWDGSKTALTSRALFAGRFTLLRADGAVLSPTRGGCISFAPAVPSPAVQIWLRAPGAGGASLDLASAPAFHGLTNFVAATLVPARGPVPPPVELAVPRSGHGYLSDGAAGTLVALSWRVGTPLIACGLGGLGPRASRATRRIRHPGAGGTNLLVYRPVDRTTDRRRQHGTVTEVPRRRLRRRCSGVPRGRPCQRPGVERVQPN